MKTAKNEIKFFALIISLLMIFSASGCSNADDNNQAGRNSQGGTTDGYGTGDYDGGKTTETDENDDYNSTDESGFSVLNVWTNSYSPVDASDATAGTGRTIASAVDVSALSFTSTFYVNLSSMSVSADNSTWQTLTDGGDEAVLLEGSVTAGLSDGVLTIYANTDASVDNGDGTTTVTQAVYKKNFAVDVTGTISKGSLCIDSNKKSAVEVYLHDASITSGNYPCIEVSGKSVVYLVAEGSNVLTDGRSYGTGYSSEDGVDFTTDSSKVVAEDEENDIEGVSLTSKWAQGSSTKGTVYSKGSLILGGSGTVTLTEGYKHGFYAKDYIRVVSGTYTVKSTGRNGFQSVNGFVMDGGTISITGTGTNTNNESRGIIVEGSEDNPGEGYIIINGGSITTKTVSKGISAKWDIDEDAETTETTDDPYPYVLITGGELSVTTTGTPADESSKTYTFTDADGVSVSETTKLSPEGIEGKQAVFVTGGVIELNCTDDGMNASREDNSCGGLVYISGGNVYCYSSNNDAIDSNGTLTITGGVIVANTATTPECAFDCDSNTFSITGGLLVGIGTNNYSKPTSSACTQSTVVLSGNYFGAGGTNFALEDSSGSPVFVYSIPTTFGTSTNSSYIMILSSPEIKTGTTYTAKTSVTVSGGTTFHGLYTTLPTVSGGSSTATGVATSTSSYVYTLSSAGSSNNGAQEGTHTNNGPGGSSSRP